jgi:hypothetical protein
VLPLSDGLHARRFPIVNVSRKPSRDRFPARVGNYQHHPVLGLIADQLTVSS